MKNFGEFYMDVNGDPVGIAIGGTLVLAGVHRPGGKGLASGGQATGWGGVVSRVYKLPEGPKPTLVIRGFC